MADMKPEEVANLANLYANLTEQIKQLDASMTQLKNNNKENTAEFLQLSAKKQEALLAEKEAQLKLKENEFDLYTQLQKNEDVLNKQAERLDKRVKALEAEKNALNAVTGTTEVVAAAKAKAAEKEYEIEEATAAYVEATEKLNAVQTKNQEIKEKIQNTDKEQLKNLIEQERKTLDLKKATDSLTASISQSIANKAALNNQYNQQIQLAAKAGTMTDVLLMSITSLRKGFKEALDPVTMFSTVLTNAVQNFQTFYEVMAKMGRELGTTVTAGFNAAASAGARMGIDAGAQAATVNALGTAFVNLGNKQREQTTQLLVASYEMQRFGIGANESITILSGFQRSLGLSAEQSAELANNLVHTARGLGLTADAVKGLANNMEQFIAYGSRANEVMLETLEVSSRFGIGTDAIAKMTTKLDSMEGSINAANTIARELGVALDPLQLLRADPAQKMEMVANAIKRSGFEGENARFQIKVLGESLGLTAAQMQLLTKQVESGSNEIGTIEKKVRDFDKAFQDFTGGQTLDGLAQLKTTLESAAKPLMLFLGLLNGILGIVMGLINYGIEFANGWGTLFGVGWGDLIAFIVVLGLAMWKLSGTMAASSSVIAGASGSIAGALGTMTTALPAAGTAIGTFFMEIGAGAALAVEGIPFLLAFGFTLLMIGGAVFLAAFGMAKLVASFKDLTGGQMAVAGLALVGLALGLKILIGALSLFALPSTWIGVAALIAVGGAVALIGLGIKLATDGIAKMVSSVTELAIALGQLKDVDLDASVTKVITSIIEPFNNAPADLEVKMKAVAQMPASLEQYAQALQVFNAAGGGTAAQVMTEKFVESMTTISEKVTATQAVPAASSGFGEGGVIQIHVRDAVVFESYIDKRIEDYDRKKRNE